MKKIIFAVFILSAAVSVFAAKEGMLIPYGPGVFNGTEEALVNTRASYSAGAGDRIYSDASAFAIYIKNGGCVRCAAGSEVKYRKGSYTSKSSYTAMEVKKGRCYFNTGYVPGARLEINAGSLIYETGEAVLLADADNNQGRLYYGAGIYYGREKQMENLKPQPPEINKDAESDYFDILNFSQDRVSLSVTVSGQGELPAKALEVIKAGLSAEYSVEYDESADELTAALNISAEGSCVAITGTVKDSGGNIVKILDIKECARNAEISDRIFIKAYIAAVNDIINAAQGRVKKYMEEGKTVIIEGDFGEEAKIAAVKELILNAPGVISAEEKVFYGKKAVYTVKCRNSGSVLALYLEGKKAQNGNITVWNSGKNIVKLKFR